MAILQVCAVIAVGKTILQVCAVIAVGKTISSITQIYHSMTLAAGVAVRGKLGYSPWVKAIKKPPHG